MGAQHRHGPRSGPRAPATAWLAWANMLGSTWYLAGLGLASLCRSVCGDASPGDTLPVHQVQFVTWSQGGGALTPTPQAGRGAGLSGSATVVPAAALIVLQRMSRGGASAPGQGCGLTLQGGPAVQEGLRACWLHPDPAPVGGRCQAPT